MLTVFFAFLFGLTVLACAGGLVGRGSRLSLLLLGGLGLLAIAIRMAQPPDERSANLLRDTSSLVELSLFTHSLWTLLGASVGIVWLLVSEGTLDGPIHKLRLGLGIEGPVVQPGPLGARDELLARLCLYAFQNSRRSILADLETALSAGAGARQYALQTIAAPGLRGMKLTEPERLVRTYQRHFDPDLRTAPLIYQVLCRLARVTGNANADVNQRLHRIGHALDLSRGEMNRALSLA